MTTDTTPAQATSELPLAGRCALVTGSTSGIGAATARTLAAAGARVVVSGRDADRAAAVVADCGPGALFVPVDLAAPAPVLRRWAQDLLAEVGEVDVLVNNAAVCPAVSTPDLSDEDLENVLAVNVRAPHVLVAALAPAMAARGRGAVVTIGSWMASTGTPFAGLYGATKAAEEQLTRAWATEFGPSGVRCNTVSPGIIRTPINAGADEVVDAMTAPTPAGTTGVPQDIADAVLWLASDASRFVHGATLRVDGGIAAVHA